MKPAIGVLARVSTVRLQVTRSESRARSYDTPACPVEPLPGGTAHATLSVVTGLEAGRIVPLEGESMVIGRGEDADLRVEDPGVSRAHARITRSATGAFYVQDLRSTNGTFLGGRRVTAAPLSTGDRLQLGPNVMLRFALTDTVDETLQSDLYESCVRDPLTKAYNRRYLAGRLVAEVAHARRHGNPLSVVMFDVDHFKQFNDRYGHFVGDRILCFVTVQVMRLLRAGDLLARFGGDEFVVLSRDTDHGQAAALADRLRHAVVSMQLAAAGGQVPLTVTLGVASLAELGSNEPPEALLEMVDRRLCAAKRDGRNRVRASDA